MNQSITDGQFPRSRDPSPQESLNASPQKSHDASPQKSGYASPQNRRGTSPAKDHSTLPERDRNAPSATESLQESEGTFYATGKSTSHNSPSGRTPDRQRHPVASAASGTGRADLTANSNVNQIWMTKLPIMLRGIGAAAVLVSLYSFLFRGWEGGSDVIRYSMLLGHTVLLAIIALASGHWFREGKGPRLLLSLALVSVPVNFAILGAFMFSAVSGVNLIDYPNYVAWTADSINGAFIATAIGVLLLIPVILLGFRTLARGMSARMSSLFLISNIALLVPLRDPVWVAGMACCLGIYTLLISAKTARQRTEVKTREGMIALLLLFLPLGILLGRNIWLYAPDAFLFTAISATGFVALRHCTQNMKHTWIRSILEFASLIVASTTGICSLFALGNAGASASVAILSGGLVAAALSYEIGGRACILNEFYRVCAVILLTGSVLLNLWISGGAVASLTTLIIGGAMLVFSYFERKRSLLGGGLLLVVIGLVDQFVQVFQLFDFGYWAGLAGIGVIAIVTASVLEARGESLRQSLRRYKDEYAEWRY